MIKSTIRIAALAGLALLATGAAAPQKAAVGKASVRKAATGNWTSQITVTPDGSFMLGNPEAPVKVTEFVSYTCPHCAELHKEADPALRAGPIPKGKVAVTVTNLLRNPIDMTVAMLTACGDPKGFFARHDAFLSTQDTWLTKAASASADQRAHWSEGELPTRLTTISNDLGFFTKMEALGVPRAKAQKCLADKAQLDQIMAQYKQANDFKFAGTPGIVINGKVLYAEENGKLLLDDEGQPMQATQWQDMKQAITKALAARTAKSI